VRGPEGPLPRPDLVAVPWPLDDGLRRRRRLGSGCRDELDRGRAADVPALVAHVQHVRAGGSGAEQNEHARRDERPPHRFGTTAQTLDQPYSSSRARLPETGTYSPCRNVNRMRPVRASAPTIRCAKFPAYTIPSTTVG